MSQVLMSSATRSSGLDRILLSKMIEKQRSTETFDGFCFGESEFSHFLSLFSTALKASVEYPFLTSAISAMSIVYIFRFSKVFAARNFEDLFGKGFKGLYCGTMAS